MARSIERRDFPAPVAPMMTTSLSLCRSGTAVVVAGPESIRAQRGFWGRDGGGVRVTAGEEREWEVIL